MPQIINPFDTSGYTLADMTSAINLIPNLYNRIGRMGVFRTEGITTRTAIIEQRQGTLQLLPPAALGTVGTLGARDVRTMRNFTLPHIPHDDVILPQDLQGIRAFGSADNAEAQAQVMFRKLETMRRKHAATREYMEINALKGIVKGGDGVTLYNYFTEFGVTQLTVDFLLGTAGTEVAEKCRAVKRAIETELQGESMTEILVLVSPGFFDKLIKHATVKEAYKYYSANSALQPLRDDVRDGFNFGGLRFQEYNATVTLSTGSTEALLAVDDGYAFPLGTQDTFTTYFAPANLMETVNTIGVELYARQIARQNGTGIDIYTESNPLPIVKRPRLVVRCYSSN